MNEPLLTIPLNNIATLSSRTKAQALHGLEAGKIIYFPSYFFTPPVLLEENLLFQSLLSSKHKNISFDYHTKQVSGLHKTHVTRHLVDLLKPFMQHYADFAKHLITTLFPEYNQSLQWGRTSYRPAEITGRISSKRKDDTRLHVDSFSATPVNGLRILRVFCNINPYGKVRTWNVGEPFTQVVKRFAPLLPSYNTVVAKCLHLLKVTKTLRSAYDHYQLHLHDRMKLDEHYQQTVTKQRVDFPSQSTWIVFTDYVSHAALGGQFLLEQTFYLPIAAMAQPELSPLHYWRKEKPINANSG